MAHSERRLSSHRAMSEEFVVSAPAKVLVAGGFLVLERPHTGTVLALDARYLKNRVMALRRHEPLSRMLPRALALIVAEPGGICEDIGIVVDHLVTSPLLVLHWLCVFPSYVYALRLLLALSLIHI